jgi:membrane associated rhomboid family serine protease
MFPIRDHNPSGRIPYVTYGLIAVNIAVFVAHWLTSPSEDALNEFFYYWGLVAQDVTHGAGYSRIFTSMFLHAGWMHLLGNMLFLWIFGDNLEDEMGRRGFLAFYLASGIAAAAAQVLADPGSPVPMVGASGAIAGVMGGYLLLYPKARVDVLFIFLVFFRIFAIPAWAVLGVWIGIQLFSGASMPIEGEGVAYWAHIGGFFGGIVLSIPIFVKLGGPSFWSRTEGHPPNPVAQYPLTASTIPKLPRRQR